MSSRHQAPAIETHGSPQRGARALSSRDLAGVEQLLSVVLDPLGHATIDAWREAVLRSLMRLLGADKAAFLMPVRGKGSFLTVNNPTRLSAEYPNVIQPLDREISVWERQAQLGAFDRQSLWRGHERAFLASPYYNEFVVPNRLHHATGLTARLDGPASASTAATIWVHHDRDRGRTFGERGLTILRLLTPAVGAAVRTVQRFDEHQESLARTIDSLNLPAAVFNIDGRLLHETPALVRLLTGDPDRAVVLQAIRGCAQSLAPRPTLRTAHACYGIDAVLSGNRLADLRPCVVVSVTRLDLSSTPRPAAGDALRDQFRLTAREQEVAVLIARGLGITEITSRLGVSRHTVRHHLERVFAKLEVHTLAAACARIRTALRAD